MWYKAAVDHALPPAWVTLKQITAECVALYLIVQPPRESILLSVDPCIVYDLVTTEYKMDWVVWRLINNCSGGPS